MIEVKIKTTSLNVKSCTDFVKSKNAGAIDLFIGTVRNKTNGKKVKYLFYEAYEKMAIAELKKIAVHAQKKWDLEKVLIHHRNGKLKIGEIATIIAVSSAHRKEAFEACRYIIDTLKKTVPIWKKEVFADGEEWSLPNP